MANIEELYRALSELPGRQYSDLIRKVDAERRKAFEQAEAANPPQPGMTRDDFARWIAARHFAIDKGIVRVMYLPTEAPPNEVRLLEVNELARIPELAPIEPVDFMPDIEGIDYTLLVADITPTQLPAIMAGKINLPPGWQLDNAQEFVRGNE